MLSLISSGSANIGAAYCATRGKQQKMRKLAFATAVVTVFLSVSIVFSAAHAEVTEKNFRIDTTKDLVALCSVDASDPNAVAAIHMCHGYVMGLVHFHILIGRALEGSVFCIDDAQRPSRDAAITKLVAWSRNHPEHDSKEAANGVVQWAADTYPCSE
jgi:hypothetical protein